jgi:hypothetical protein
MPLGAARYLRPEAEVVRFWPRSPDRGHPPASPTPAELARWLDTLRVTLSQLGRPAEALPVIEEAVTIFRELAAASPDRYRPDVARSLTSLASRMAELGRIAEAETIRKEAGT